VRDSKRRARLSRGGEGQLALQNARRGVATGLLIVNRRFKTSHQNGASTSQPQSSILLCHKFLLPIAEGLVAKNNAAHHASWRTVQSADFWPVSRAD